MSIEYKSTGMLFDELFTTELKLAHWPDNEEVKSRRHELGNVITARLLHYYQSIEWKFTESPLWVVAHQLRDVLEKCWNAQETVMRYTGYSSKELETKLGHDNLVELAEAAIAAQRTNAERNRYIREIDKLTGEVDATPLEKTYK